MFYARMIAEDGIVREFFGDCVSLLYAAIRILVVMTFRSISVIIQEICY